MAERFVPLESRVLATMRTTRGWKKNRLAVALGMTAGTLYAYESGDSTMGFHSDSVGELEPRTGIAIVSLGAERRITFQYKRGKKEEFHYLLKSGSLLYMSPEIQQARLAGSSRLRGKCRSACPRLTGSSPSGMPLRVRPCSS